MRAVRFPSAIAASLALLAASAAGQSITADIGPVDVMIGSTSTGPLNRPIGCNTAPNGDLYIASYDGNRIRRVAAGTTTPVNVGPDAIDSPIDLVIDAQGDYMYFLRYGVGDVRKMDLNNVVAGSTNLRGGFNAPSGIDIMASSGLLYFCVREEHTLNSMQTDGSNFVERTNAVFTARGMGIRQGPDLVYVISFQNRVIYEVSADGSSTTVVAGSVGASALVDGTGTSARFQRLVGCSISRDGNYLMVSDRPSNSEARLRSVDLTTFDVKTVMNIAGTTTQLSGASESYNARFGNLDGSCFSPGDSHLYVLSRHAVQRVAFAPPQPTPAPPPPVITRDIGAVDIMIGSTSTGPLNRPIACSTAPNGDLFIASFDGNRIRRVAAGSTTPVNVGPDSIDRPIDLVIDAQGDYMYYVRHLSNGDVRSIDLNNMPAGSTVVRGGYDLPSGIDIMASSGLLYFSVRNEGKLNSMQTDGSNFVERASGLNTARAMAIRQGPDLVYVVSILNHVIYEVSADGSSTTVVAGQAGVEQQLDGTGTAARFQRLVGCSISLDGRFLYVSDRPDSANEARLRSVDLTTFDVKTVMNAAGTTDQLSGASESYNAKFGLMDSSCFSPAGDTLYVLSRHAVQRVAYSATPEPTTTTTTTTTTQAPGTCDCAGEKLQADYTSDVIPDATADAISNISLDTDTWEVVFEVRNVKAISNGHVIAAAVNTQQTAADAFTPLVSAFNANDLWSPLECGLGGIDTPATNLKVRTEWDSAACRTKYEMRYSLISTENRDDTYCDLTDDNAGNIKVNCSIVLSSVRAFSATEQTAFTAQEAAFAAELNLGTYLNNEVTDLLHATMAKCSVKNGPLYVVDCRVPGVWNFDQSAFSVAQSPAGWIDAVSCASNVVGSDAATAATFIRCNIENDAPIANVERALANISATPTGNPSNALTFDVDFIVPRKVTTTASASLASFVQTIEMKDGRYYYGTADIATLEITVVDTARLSMTALELFNSATPSKQVYDIFPGTSDARFQTALNADATKFTIDFYPAAIREDSAFYRFGPHGINVSFTFSAARRVTGGGTGGQGNVLVEGLNVEGTEAATSSSAQGSAASSSSGTALMAGVAVGAAVLVAGLVGAAVLAVKRRGATKDEAQL